MALNIKNERVCRLAKEAAERTGRTQVSVLEEALEDRAAVWRFMNDEMYDEDGLPA